MRLVAPIAMFAVLAACNTRMEPPVASGTIEITQTDVAPVVPARVMRVLAAEGDAVRAGDTLALLSQSTLPADIEQRRARVRAASADLRDLQQGARPAEIERARSELQSADAEAQRTERDAARLEAVAAAGGISQSQLEAAQSAARVAASRRDAVGQALELLLDGARPERIQAARSALAAAEAQLAMAEALATDLVLLAPTDGVVLARYVEPGEVIAAGIPVVSLGDPRRLWIRVFVTAPLMAQIRLGGRARLSVEGIPDRVFAATIIALATEAEFTPRVALTEEERADLLFGVKLELDDASGTLKSGLPATVVFDPDGPAGGEEPARQNTRTAPPRDSGR